MHIDAYLYRKRRIKNGIALIFGSAAAVLGLGFLAWILGTTLIKGVSALSPSIFVEMTPPPGAADGGLANALFGSVLITLLATAIGAPIGILAGLWLAEYARHSKLAWWCASSTTSSCRRRPSSSACSSTPPWW